MIYRKVILLLIFSTLFSCKKKENFEKYYPSGNLKSSEKFNKFNNIRETYLYYDLPKKKIKQIIFHKEKYDSVVYYYQNGKIFKHGKTTLDKNLFGKWEYYTKEGYLSDTREFMLVNNNFDKGYRLNQIWYFNQQGDTMFYGNNNFNIYNQKEFLGDTIKAKRSVFVRFDFYPKGDTLNINEPFRGYAEDSFPFWSRANSECYILLAKEESNFNSDFSNIKEVKLDTFFCLEKDKINKKTFTNVDLKHTVVFGRWFNTPGKKILRGYMAEYYTQKTKTDNDIKIQERRTYFEKVIYVR